MRLASHSVISGSDAVAMSSSDIVEYMVNLRDNSRVLETVRDLAQSDGEYLESGWRTILRANSKVTMWLFAQDGAVRLLIKSHHGWIPVPQDLVPISYDDYRWACGNDDGIVVDVHYLILLLQSLGLYHKHTLPEINASHVRELIDGAIA